MRLISYPLSIRRVLALDLFYPPSKKKPLTPQESEGGLGLISQVSYFWVRIASDNMCKETGSKKVRLLESLECV